MQLAHGRESLTRIAHESLCRLGLLPLGERSRLRRYAGAAAALLLAEALAQLFHPAIQGEVYFLFYLPAVIAATWYGGFGPGMFSTAAGAGMVAHRGIFFTASEIESLVIFVLSGILISVLYTALRTALGWTNEILETTHDAFFMLDRKGRFRYVNREAEKLWLRRREDLLGRRYKEAFPEAIGSEAYLAVERSLTGQIPARLETIGPISKTWIEIRIRPFEGGVSVYFHDISAHKMLERALTGRVARSTARFKEVNDELDAFTYSASHDLRGPVRKIMNYCDLIIGSPSPELPEEQRAWFLRIRASAVQIDRIIDEMQNLAEATQSELTIETVDLSGLAREVFEAVRRTDPDRRFAFTVAPGLTARADARLFRLALCNVIDNAWKFTSLKEESRIELGATSADGEPVFFVKDNGVGFDMAHAAKMFIAFEQLNQRDAFPGMGVGLAIAQRVIHRHGGKIWAESRPGEGSTFYFTLPMGAE
ncbi:MAG: ATP-binding protein [Elusimicrobiota bacterium]|nr:ATP-binding protein [Elusimicrobiota bacterium]